MEFVHEIAVRYAEVDQLGVVFNAHYLTYFDEAQTAFLEHIGAPYPELLAGGTDCMLVHSEIDWLSSIGFGDRVGIAVSCQRVGTTSFSLGFEVRKAGSPTCRATIVYVCVATDGSGKRPLPDQLRSALAN